MNIDDFLSENGFDLSEEQESSDCQSEAGALRYYSIYYVPKHLYRRTAQNLIWHLIFLKKLGFFLSKQKNVFLNITYWRNFDVAVWKFLVN